MTTQNPPDSVQRVAESLAQADRFRRAGRQSDAERVCREAVAAYPRAANALNYLALLIGERGEFGEAEDLLRRAIALVPREAALHNNLGNLRRKVGDLPGAESFLRAAVALNPVYSEAYYNLGLVLRELDRLPEALAAQRRAVTLRPAYAEALTQIGSLLKDGAKYADALHALDSAIAARADYFDAHYYRGDVLAALGRFGEAEAAFQTALALRPNSHEAHYALGNALNRAKREGEALEAFGKAIDLAPDFLAAHHEYNALAWTTGRHDLNLKSYARARQRVGDKPDLLLSEAAQRLRHEDAAAAELLLRRAHEGAPERTDVTNILARALAMQKRFGESIALLETLVRTEPAGVQHYRELGSVLLRDGQPAEARRVLEQAYTLEPFDQINLAFMALAYRELGDSRLDRLVDLEKFVAVYDVPPPRGFADVKSFNDALGEELLGLHTRNVEPFDQTLRRGTQSPGFLFEQPTGAIAAVRDGIDEALADYIGRLPADPAHPFLARKQNDFSYIGAWSCRLRSSGFHTNHVHPEGWISSAYYVSLPEAVADERGKQGWLKFGESNIALGERDRPGRVVKPGVGKLVLFPSYFWHGTVPFESDEMRLTVAFDVVPGKLAVRPRSSGY